MQSVHQSNDCLNLLRKVERGRGREREVGRGRERERGKQREGGRREREEGGEREGGIEHNQGIYSCAAKEQTILFL